MGKFKILQGTIRADDGSVKGPGDEIAIGDDQVDRFPGQLELVRDADLPAPQRSFNPSTDAT